MRSLRCRAVCALLLSACTFPCTASAAATDYRENFNDGAAQGWTPLAGVWGVAGGTYHSSAMGAPNGAVYGGNWATDFSYHVRAKMNNAGAGNRVGAVYNYQDASNYYEVEIQPVGQGGPPHAFLNNVIGGTTNTIATAPYSGGGPDVWVDIDVIRSGTVTTVKINGTVVFDTVPQPELGAGSIGLITRFAEGRFDNIVLTAPFLENFDDGTAQGWMPLSGAWGVEAGTYHSTAVGSPDGTVYGDGSWATDFTYRVRAAMNNANTGNRVGAIYNFQDADNYYEVEIQPVGEGGRPHAFLIEVIDGALATIATAPYDGGGPGVWVDIDVIRSGAATTVEINGAVVFDSVSQTELGAGRIGLVTRFANGRFDDVSLSVNGADFLFWSGFEPNTSLLPPADCGTAGDPGCYQAIDGTDGATGYTWPPDSSSNGAAFLHGKLVLIADAPVDPNTIGDYMSNRIEVAAGHDGNLTTSLYQEIAQNPNGQEPMQTNVTQSFLNLAPETDGELYMSFRLKFQSDLVAKMTNLPQVHGTRGCADTDPATDDCGTFRAFFSFKTGTPGEDDGDYRVEVYVVTDNNAAPFWGIVGDNVARPWPWVELPPGAGFLLTNDLVPVPIDEWFKFEIFWRRSAGADGRVWVAVDGQTIFDRHGPNMGGASLPVNRIIAPLLYSGGRMPIYQWIDDLQIWQGFPTVAPGEPGYDPPYAPH